MVSSVNGFSMKSTTPARMASTARGTSPWPVMTMTGRGQLRVLSSRTSSRPDISGIRTSVTMQPGSRLASPARKFRAES